jgi:hypothetical protein
MGFLEDALTELPEIDRRLEVLHNSILELNDKYKVLDYLEEKNKNRDRSSPIFFNPRPNGGKKTGKNKNKNKNKNKKSKIYKKRKTNKNKRK